MLQEVLKEQYKYEYYKYFYDMAPVGFYRTSIQDGFFLHANPFLIKMFGFNSLEELQNNITSKDIYPQERRQELLDELRINGEVTDFEIEVVLPNNVCKSLLITARICPDDDCIEGSIMDITQRKNELKSLKDTQGLLKKMQSLTSITDEIKCRLSNYK